MNGPNAERRGQAGLSIEQLLSYERHIDDGEAFCKNVLATIARRNRRRGWILGGAAMLAPAMAMAIKPEEFSFLSNLRPVLAGAGQIVEVMPAGGLMAMLVIGLLLFGVTKTVDSL